MSMDNLSRFNIHTAGAETFLNMDYIEIGLKDAYDCKCGRDQRLKVPSDAEKLEIKKIVHLSDHCEVCLPPMIAR
jgi:hypothetical protein